MSLHVHTTKKPPQFLNVLKSKDGLQGKLTLDQYSVQSKVQGCH